ncbi:uncharacterized protein LOC119995839 [Tripterygium wilfordii]|uniref:uncharacterized protein LOC119995839 n=1 Tax=Tripterygium wilfordii TaxID=458696 RepID=UPI0018F8263B|nr:uncharacterized protein LOC119995839 [Tripterygium wilfordii]
MPTRNGKDYAATDFDSTDPIQQNELMTVLAQQLPAMTQALQQIPDMAQQITKLTEQVNQLAGATSSPTQRSGKKVVQEIEEEAGDEYAEGVHGQHSKPRNSYTQRTGERSRAFRHEPKPEYFRHNCRQYGHFDQTDQVMRQIKADVPEFDGNQELHEVMDWLAKVENFFDWVGMNQEQKVRFIRMKFKGQACVWWQSLEEQRYHSRLPSIMDWREMKGYIMEEYLPHNYKEIVFRELLSLEQESKSVREFNNKFHELIVRSRVIEDPQQSLARYKRGLREEISRELETTKLENVREAFQLALKIESRLKSQYNKRYQPSSLDYKSSRAVTNSLPTQGNMAARTETGTNTTTPTLQRGKEPGGPKCYKCGTFGHYAAVNTEVIDEVLEPSELPMCVIRQILTGQMVEPSADEWLRTSIFRTRFEKDGKALEVIIDGGSSMNVISKDMVERNGLITEKHTKPYLVGWIDDTTIP